MPDPTALPSKRDLIARTRQAQGLTTSDAGTERRDPQPPPQPAQGQGVPAVVQRAVQQAPAQQQPVAQQRAVQGPQQPVQGVTRVAAPPPSRAAVAARAPGGPVQVRVEGGGGSRPLDVSAVGGDLRRIARALGQTRPFVNERVLVRIELYNDPAEPLGVSVALAVPGSMGRRYVATGNDLHDITAQLVRMLNGPQG